jgi:choline dehydrogenase-like flavoprotein
MSEKPRDGVVNKFGQTHDIKNLFISDGSQFTSGAACNPTLTIVSLAIRQAVTSPARCSARRSKLAHN